MDRTNPDAHPAAAPRDDRGPDAVAPGAVAPGAVAPDGAAPGGVGPDPAVPDPAVPDPAVPDPAVPDPDASDLVVSVTVTRTGGIAGLRRAWRAEADEAAAPTWIQLIEGCPWDAVADGRFHPGADRFVWAVDARCGDDERRAELADDDVRGPWRELIDAVREAGSPMPRERD